MKEVDENVFKAGEYVVLLSSCDGKNCWAHHGGWPENYCYELAEDSNSFYLTTVQSTNGYNGNHWGSNAEGKEKDKEINKLKLRAATSQEIAYYKAYNKPFDVRELYVKKTKENYNYLKKIFKKLNIK